MHGVAARATVERMTRPRSTDWSDALLDAKRGEGDPSADAVVAAIFADGAEAARRVNELLRDLVDNDDVPAASLPAEVRDYFLAGELPAWADRDAIELASQVFHRHAPAIVLLLHTAALPTCYAGRKGVQVLARTGQIHSNTQRRILETAQFVIDVMAPGGLLQDPQRFGAGLRSAQKVRLMHATIRHFLRHDPTWDPAWDTPINQEDLAGTMLSFSAVTLHGLERLGIDLTVAEREAYLHTWNVIGALLGVDPALMPVDYHAAMRLGAAIVRRQHAPCPEGQMMTRALLDYLEYTLPGSALDGLPALLMHDLDPAVAAILGVERPAMHPRWILAMRTFGGIDDELGDHSAFLRRAAAFTGRLTLQGLLLAYRGPRRAPFRIPLALRETHRIL